MVYESCWLILPAVMAWLWVKFFQKVFHPAFLEREITSDGKNEMNPYFNVGYAASPYEKQKDAYLRLVKSFGYLMYIIIVVPTFFMDYPGDNIFNQEIKFSPIFKFAASGLASLYLNDLLWNEMDDTLLGVHHLATILAVFIVLTESSLLPAGLMLIRCSALPIQDGIGDFISFLVRFNWADQAFWQTFRLYAFILACLIVYVCEWLYVLYAIEEKSFAAYICIIIWELTDTWTIYLLYKLVQNVQKIIKKKIAREMEYMAELDQVKEDPCGGESLATDTVSDLQVELSVLTE